MDEVVGDVDLRNAGMQERPCCRSQIVEVGLNRGEGCWNQPIEGYVDERLFHINVIAVGGCGGACHGNSHE